MWNAATADCTVRQIYRTASVLYNTHESVRVANWHKSRNHFIKNKLVVNYLDK